MFCPDAVYKHERILLKHFRLQGLGTLKALARRDKLQLTGFTGVFAPWNWDPSALTRQKCRSLHSAVLPGLTAH